VRPQDLDTRALGGEDPIDAHSPAFGRDRGVLWRFRVRAALGLRPLIAPSLLFIPLGALLGPYGAGMLSATVLENLQPVIMVALVVLGVFVGVAFGRRRSTRRILAAAASEAALTMVVVSGAIWYLLIAWGLDLGVPPALVAVGLGIVASVSSAPAEGTGASRALAVAIADFDDILPVVIGAVVLAFAHPLGVERAALLGMWAIAFAALIAVAADQLFRTADAPERGTFLVGALGLIAGGAAYIGGSALLAGFVAGAVWSRLRPSLAAVEEGFGKLQHPFMVAMLIVAGASAVPSMLALWLAVPVIVFRMAGKLLGAAIANRLMPSGLTADLGAALITPGVLGVAFALQFGQFVGPVGPAIVSAAALATVVNELIGLAVMPGELRS
jgi:hypothetical protein